MKKFRIYPFKENKDKWDKSCWWLVKVYSDKKELRKALKEKCKRCDYKSDISSDILGQAHRHSYKQTVDDWGQIVKYSLSGELGKIFLSEENCGGGIVSHEMTHAMLYTVSTQVSIINSHDPMWHIADERMAQIVGNLVNQFYNRYD